MLKTAALLAAALLAASSAEAAEISLVSGLYRTEKTEVAGGGDAKKTTIDLGGRFSDQMDTQWHWFGQGALVMRSYGGQNAPSDSTSISLGGGLRYYFTRFGDSVVPFAYGLVSYKNEQDSEPPTGTTLVEHESSGLFYGASAGVRLNFGTAFFLDLEAELFESALFATDKEETTVTTAAGKTTTKAERTRTELHVNSTGSLQNVALAFGMKL